MKIKIKEFLELTKQLDTAGFYKEADRLTNFVKTAYLFGPYVNEPMSARVIPMGGPVDKENGSQSTGGFWDDLQDADKKRRNFPGRHNTDKDIPLNDELTSEEDEEPNIFNLNQEDKNNILGPSWIVNDSTSAGMHGSTDDFTWENWRAKGFWDGWKNKLPH